MPRVWTLVWGPGVAPWVETGVEHLFSTWRGESASLLQEIIGAREPGSRYFAPSPETSTRVSSNCEYAKTSVFWRVVWGEGALLG
jgi:hypothetical protein